MPRIIQIILIAYIAISLIYLCSNFVSGLRSNPISPKKNYQKKESSEAAKTVLISLPIGFIGKVFVLVLLPVIVFVFINDTQPQNFENVANIFGEKLVYFDDKSLDLDYFSRLNGINLSTYNNNLSVSDPETKEFINGSQKIIHFRYQEATEQVLVESSMFELTRDERTDYLHRDAEISLSEMISSAEESKVFLVPLSGFRSYQVQSELFDVAVQKHGSEFEAAYLTAPPGYSEHHTGFAIDIGDKKRLELNLKYEFEQTDAYKWLARNAAAFGFEMSFPRDNYQGVSFEPWHWRYVGTDEANAVFKTAKGL